MSDERPLAEGEVECRNCQARYVPNFTRDYYGGKDGHGGLCESCMMREAFSKIPKRNPVLIVDDDRLNNSCLVHQGSKTCRYLAMGSEGMTCLKNSDMQSAIDQRASGMGSKGNNCSGPPEYLLAVVAK